MDFKLVEAFGLQCLFIKVRVISQALLSFNSFEYNGRLRNVTL